MSVDENLTGLAYQKSLPRVFPRNHFLDIIVLLLLPFHQASVRATALASVFVYFRVNGNTKAVSAVLPRTTSLPEDEEDAIRSWEFKDVPGTMSLPEDEEDAIQSWEFEDLDNQKLIFDASTGTDTYLYGLKPLVLLGPSSRKLMMRELQLDRLSPEYKLLSSAVKTCTRGWWCLTFRGKEVLVPLGSVRESVAVCLHSSGTGSEADIDHVLQSEWRMLGAAEPAADRWECLLLRS